MKKQGLETFLFSVAGVAALFVVIVALNFIVGQLSQRIDLTEEKLYSLSDGTKRILKNLDGLVEVRLYVSQEDMPVQLKAYGERVEDLLKEYEKVSGGKVRVQKFNPEPDTDAEDSASLDGVEGQATRTGNRIYLGVAVSYADTKAAVPFLSPARENLLEYDVSRAISQVTSESKTVLGVMSPLPIFGTPANPMMARMGQQPQQPLILVSELRQDFEVREVAMDVDEIERDITELLVIHPKDITDKTQYAIDQFLMRGGKLIACLDPLALMDQAPAQNPMMPSMPGSSSMDKLLKAWGLEFEKSKVVADMNYARELSFQQGQPPQLMPAFLFVNPNGIATNDVVTSQLDNIWLPFAGAFSGSPVEGLTKTVLLSSTEQSQLVDGFLARMSGESIRKDFQPSGTRHELAIRLEGKFKTAFPEGKPADPAAEEEGDDDAPAASGESLKESTKDTAVVLIGDSDFVFDQFCVQRVFGRMVIPQNGNLTLIQNMAEQFAGDSDLIAVRSRATLNRPFTVVRNLEEQAEAQHREEIKRIEDKLQETQQKLNELQANKADGERFILSPQQQQELIRFREEEREAKIRLRTVNKQLKKDIDLLKNKIKVLNIAGMPFVVVLIGLSVAFVKRQRTRAR